jgi:hypothetical protein
MSLGRLRTRKLRGWVILPLLPVLALRLLVPEGFMPRFGEHLELSVQMCHGDGKSSAAMRMLQDDAPAPAGDDGQQHSACTFAATAAATPPDPTVAVLGAVTGSATEPLPRLAAPALPLQHRPQSPRAPPNPV